MEVFGKLGLLKSVGDKRWAILGEEGKVLTKIDLNDWLMDKIGNNIYFRIDDNSVSLRDLDIEYRTVGG